MEQSRDGLSGKMRDKRNYYPPLPRIEILLYFIVWVGCHVYSIYPLFGLSKKNERYYDRNGYLETGWRAWTGRNKDENDFEWTFWKRYVFQVVLIGFTGHFITARITDFLYPKYRFKIFAVYSAIFSVFFLGPHGFALMLGHFAVQYIVAVLTKSIIACWVTGCALVFSLTQPAMAEFLKQFYSEPERAYFVLFATAMCNLRYIAFSIEYVWSLKKAVTGDRDDKKVEHVTKTETNVEGLRKRVHAKKTSSEKGDGKMETKQTDAAPTKNLPLSFIDLLIYQMYFPLFYGGPIINYNEYLEQMKRPPVRWTQEMIRKFVVGLLRYAFWHFFIDIILHFLYLSVLPLDHSLMRKMPIRALCGMALCQVYFFYMKYVILYGMPSFFSISDNLDIPRGPQCVGSKHRLTDMWKYFDKGLHKWLVRYLFIPLGGSNVSLPRLTVNSIVPFAFVCFWHGGTKAQMHWAGLSWIGVYIEALALQFYKLEWVRNIESSSISPAWSRRIRAAFSSATFGLLITSNLYFLSGVYVGNLYWKRFYYENAFSTLLIHLSLYLGVQCSMEFERMGIES